MAVKAKLRLVLMAGSVEIAESEDERLWRSVLSAISGGDPEAVVPTRGAAIQTSGSSDLGTESGTVESLAKKLNITSQEFEGACSPSVDAPYIHIDLHCWEAYRRNFPNRGLGAVGPIQLSSTLLALWMNEAKLGSPTQAQALDVLREIHVEDKNPSRGIRNCRWLQPRNGRVVLNPAQLSQAIRVARAFCKQTPLSGTEV